MKQVIKSAVLTLSAAIGGVAVVAGEFDDSPGLSGLGLIILGISFYLNVKSRR